MGKADETLLVWMDMEMTGLNVQKERILEIAVLITDGNLNITAEGPELVIHQPDEILAQMDEWNTTHHTASGLVQRVRDSKISEADAEALITTFLKVNTTQRACPLAGNSIHQDRLFIAKYMPRVEAHLHYRNVDVSTIKELGKRWFPKRIGARPTKKASHRALDDIRESIEELRYYRKALFVSDDVLPPTGALETA